MGKQDKPAHLAHRTQNLFHLERPQNQPHNDMTAFFLNQAAANLFECGERNVFPNDFDPFPLKIRSFFSGA